MERRWSKRQQERQIRACDGPIASAAATGGSPSQRDGDSQGGEEQDCSSQEGKRMRHSEPTLPEDILCHIHSLLPLRDAARAACVSHVFLNSWRCRSNLYFSMEALGLKFAPCGHGKSSRDFIERVDYILKKHPRTGLKTFGLAMNDCYHVDFHQIDVWLRVALTSGIEELILMVCPVGPHYDFPVSLLSDKSGNSIQHLQLRYCTFRPTVRLSCFRSLKRLNLHYMRFSGDELWRLLADSFALEQLALVRCKEIVCLTIPRELLRLRYLEVVACESLVVIKSEAPNLSSFSFKKFPPHADVSLGEASQVKKLEMINEGAIYYARRRLPTIVPNLETLTIDSLHVVDGVPCMPSKFRQLKYLNIRVHRELYGRGYDYFSLDSFLDASPCLETFILRVHVPETSSRDVKHALFSGDPSQLRQLPERRHDRLNYVQIAGFYPAKSLLELACHVLETAPSLDCLALGTTYCSCSRPGRDRDPAQCHLLAIRRYIEGKVPATARLDVRGPCTGCRGFKV